MNPKTISLALICASSVLLSGCFKSGADASHSGYSKNANPSNDAKNQPNAAIVQDIGTKIRSTVRIAFDPENQILPFPNNLLFEAGATNIEDLNGTLNVPIDDPDAASATVAKALNELNGFSTVEGWRIAFTGEIDPKSLEVGRTVRVFEMEVDDQSYPNRIRPSAVKQELSSDDIYLHYQAEGNVVLIQPRKPLKHGTTYSAIIMHGVTDLEGKWVDGSLTAAVAKGKSALELNEDGQPTVCDDLTKSSVALIQCHTHFAVEPVVTDSRYNVKRNNIMLAWGVTTQRADNTFQVLANAITQDEAKPSIPEGITCETAVCFLDVDSLPEKDAPETPAEQAYVYPGSIRLPILTAEVKQELDTTTNAHFLMEEKLSTPQYEAMINANWQCPDDIACNSDQAFANDVSPTIKGWATHPIVLSVPKDRSICPSTGCPVVIFQHAIQQDRTNALALADNLASQGFAVVAIDMPLHGMSKPDDADPRAALFSGNLNNQLYYAEGVALITDAYPARNIIPLTLERTYYADLVDNDSGLPGSDNVVDASGTHFLNPSLPLTQRDTLRQGALDLVTLAHFLRSGNFSQCGTTSWKLASKEVPYKNGQSCAENAFEKQKTWTSKVNLYKDIDFSQLHFVGHSVGNIVAAPFLAYDQDIRSVAMLAPAGATLRTLEASSVIGPKLADGLAEKDIFAGTEDYYRFFTSVQAVIDGVEPLNHAAAITTRNGSEGQSEPRPVYVALIAGNDDNAGDKVLPLAATHQPLAGSLALTNAMGLSNSSDLLAEQDNSSHLSFDNNGAPLQTAILFSRGDHASFLLPEEDIEDATINGADPHVEMQRQVVNFLGNDGLEINDIKRDFLK